MVTTQRSFQSTTTTDDSTESRRAMPGAGVHHMGVILAAVLLMSPGCANTRTTPLQPSEAAYAPPAPVEPFVPNVPLIAPSTAKSLSLDDLLVYADTHAPVIRAAEARIGLADAALVDAEIVAPANPEVGLGVGGRTVGGDTGFELELSIQQQLEIAGERGLRQDAARSERLRVQSAVNEVRWSVHVEVHRLHTSLLLAAERSAQAKRFAEFSKALRDIAQRQVDSGESSPLILLVADADLAQTRGALVRAEAAQESLRARLAAVIGWTGKELPVVSGNLPPVRRAPNVQTLLDAMAEHHPSLRTREIAVLVAQSQLELERREAWPKPTLGITYGHEASPGGGPEEHVWLFSLTVPIPAWRSNQGGQATAEAELRVADRERSATYARLHGELAQAAIELDAAADSVEIQETGVVPQIEQHLSLLQRAYELGEVDVHQVSQTRQRLLDAMDQHLEARFAYFEAAAVLEGLAGTEPWSSMEVAP